MKLPKTVILAVLILLPACKTEEPPDPVQNAASSLRELGKEWEGKYREYLHYSSNTNRNICGMLSHGSQEFLQECQEVQVDQGRAFLASAYNGRSDMSRMVSEFIIKHLLHLGVNSCSRMPHYILSSL